MKNQAPISLCALAAIGMAFSQSAHAQTPAASLKAPEPVANTTASDDWFLSLSADYYRYESKYQRLDLVSGGSPIDGNKDGDLVGATIGFAPPSWFNGGKLRRQIEISARQGDLTGNVNYPAFGTFVSSSLESDWTEISILYKDYPEWKFMSFNEKGKWIMGIGLQYDKWDTSESLPATVSTPTGPVSPIWTISGTPVREEEQQAIMVPFSLEYQFILTHEFDNSTALSYGVRGQASLAVGAGMLDHSNAIAADDEALLIGYGGGRATGFVDFHLPSKQGHLYSLFLEGGWLYQYWFSSQSEEGQTDSLKGPYARVGVRFSF